MTSVTKLSYKSEEFMGLGFENEHTEFKKPMASITIGKNIKSFLCNVAGHLNAIHIG